MHRAACDGVVDALDALLESSDADVNQINDAGVTPLMLAAQQGHMGALRWLLNHKAQVNAVDLNQCTALFFAVEASHEDACGLLLAWNADIEARHKYGHTPLMLAAHYGQQAAVGLLLDEGGAKIDACTANG